MSVELRLKGKRVGCFLKVSERLPQHVSTDTILALVHHTFYYADINCSFIWASSLLDIEICCWNQRVGRFAAHVFAYNCGYPFSFVHLSIFVPFGMVMSGRVGAEVYYLNGRLLFNPASSETVVVYST